MGFFDLFRNKTNKQQEADIENVAKELPQVQEDAEQTLEEKQEEITEKKENAIEEDAVYEKLMELREGTVEEDTVEEDTVEEDVVYERPIGVREDTVGEKVFQKKLETAQEIVFEVAEEMQKENEEALDTRLVEEVIKEVETIEEGIAEEVLEAVTEPVREIVLEAVSEMEEETKETIPKPVIEEVIEKVETIEQDIQEDIEKEKQGPKKKGFFTRLLAGLDKTRKNILGGVDAVLGGFTKIDDDLFEELEEALIMSDLGVATTMDLIEALKSRVKKERVTEPQAVKGLLIEEIAKILQEGAEEKEELPDPTVMLVIGVNGVGKTTTIGKLSHNFKTEGKKVLLAAADTFRAAAIDQLLIWGERAGIEVIRHQEGSDPAAVVFDAVSAAKNRKADLLICDTAGRLHNKKNLMEELKKIAKVIEREWPQVHKETYLVLDATTGQNALQQAKLFQEVCDITGIILTKLDGTAKGGIVIAIKSELKIPVCYIGVGEGIEDLQKFEAEDFAKALFGEG